jgi:ligand-binding sensor domain-containing protein/two-component sensor histidine kinase
MAKSLRKKILTVFTYLLLILCIWQQPSEAEELPIKNYISTDGLIYEKVERIYQDSRGFVWVTTPIGVSRFDGYQFFNYGLDNAFKTALITDMVEDNDGVYWFGTQWEGVYRFDPRTAEKEAENDFKKCFEKISIEPANKFVFRLLKTHSGKIYAATEAGLFLLNQAEKSFSRVELNLPPSQKTPGVDAIAEDADGSVWVGHQFGLSRILPNGAVINYSVLPTDKENDRIYSLSIDRENRVWLVGEKRRLVVFNPEPLGSIDLADTSRRAILLKPENKLGVALPQGTAYVFTAEEALADGDFNDVLATTDGKIWVAAYSKGLVEFNGHEFRLYTKANGLSDITITTLTEDRSGNLWVGSEWGAMRLTNKSFSIFRTADGMGSDRVRGMFEDRDGVLYVINSLWGINRFDGKKFTNIKMDLPKGNINWLAHRILSDSAGEWWFATGEGLYRFAPVEKFEQLPQAKPINIYNKKNGLMGERISALYEDSHREIWLGLSDKVGTLTSWKRETGEFQTFTKENGFPEKCLPRYFREDAAGTLIIGCSQHAIVVMREGKFISYQSEDYLPKGWWIGDVQVDPKGRIWAASPTRGLLRIDNLVSGNPQVRLYTMADGLGSFQTQFIAIDNDGKIYAINHRGMDVLEPESGKVKQYTIADGLSDAGSGVALRDRQGNLWFGGNRGVTRFTPQSEKTQQPPPIYIGGLRVGGRDIPINAVGETEISGMTLESDQRQIRIEFFGLALSTGEALRYQYKLEGLDEDWSEPVLLRNANYTSIAPGSYRFLVRAVSGNGSVSTNPAVVSFTVLRPFWLRWWFLLTAALLVGWSVYVIYRYRVNRLLELERVRTRIATDLHDDIGSSLSQIAILSEVVKQKVGGNGAEEPLNLIANTSREMVDSMSDIVWAINPQKDHLSDLLQRMRHFASDVLEARDIEHHFYIPEITHDLHLGTDLRREVYLIFKETVNNLVKYSKASKAEINVKIESSCFVLAVEDDGIGFNPAEKIDSHTTYGGNGLLSMKRRAKALGGELIINSKIGRGTKVTLKIPLNRQGKLRKRKLITKIINKPESLP